MKIEIRSTEGENKNENENENDARTGGVQQIHMAE